jgi:hypothetical protein
MPPTAKKARMKRVANFIFGSKPRNQVIVAGELENSALYHLKIGLISSLEGLLLPHASFCLNGVPAVCAQHVALEAPAQLQSASNTMVSEGRQYTKCFTAWFHFAPGLRVA